ncbi:MAG: hydroxymethylbilane synthase, partial [Pirellulaceae bacterium]|nr:hydroxymethylbilane synthase [Pirellulaceae bacterium]
MKKIRIGTRGSQLALWQANWVAKQLEHYASVELVIITAKADTHSRPIHSGASQGAFTKEIQEALLDNRVDLAVHSLKDLPTDNIPELAISAVPKRESQFDLFLSIRHDSLAAVPEGEPIGTGSLRRQAQLLYAYPNMVVKGIRGNLNTRLDKLVSNEYGGLILAEAGLKRLGMLDHVREVLPVEKMVPAIGQGALGLEIRKNDVELAKILRVVDDPASHAAVLAERQMLRQLAGGCLAPIGGMAIALADSPSTLQLTGTVLQPHGKKRLLATST